MVGWRVGLVGWVGLVGLVGRSLGWLYAQEVDLVPTSQDTRKTRNCIRCLISRLQLWYFGVYG